MEESPVILPDFEKKKRNYFGAFARGHLNSLRPHKEHGVLVKAEGWRNVSEHCLLEAVMADVFAEKLGLSEEERNNLVNGALLHDFFKKKQIEMLREDKSLESLRRSDEASAQALRELKFPEEIVNITHTAADVEKMASQMEDTTLSEKIMYYVDSIVMNHSIATIDESFNKREINPNYQQLNEEGRLLFTGETWISVHRKTSKKVQTELAKRLNIEDPETLPRWIEEEIKKRIEATNI